MQYLYVPDVVARHLERCRLEESDLELYALDARGKSVRVPVRFKCRPTIRRAAPTSSLR